MTSRTRLGLLVVDRAGSEHQATTYFHATGSSWPMGAAFVPVFLVSPSQNFICYGVRSFCKSGEIIQAQPQICNED